MRFPHETTEDKIVECYEEILRWYSELDRKTTWMTNISHITSTTAAQRRLVASYEKKIAPYSKEKLLGMAFYGGSALQRGMVTAVFWIHPPVYKHCLVENREQALTWVRGLLSA